MCCFSGDVKYVNNTRIFARAENGIRQFIVYQMAFEANDDLAMILPLPVRHGSSENAVQFIDLSGYPEFFNDLRKGFPVPVEATAARGYPPPASVPASLKVHEVGRYEASFVPAISDFNRLDQRFRLADDVWKELPMYGSYGFAVFKLKSGSYESHPMAFSFPRRQIDTLFFPTVHIHDEAVHEKAEFDHTLYCQPSANIKLIVRNWKESDSLLKNFADASRSKGVVDANQHCYQLMMKGNLKNTDVHVSYA